MLISFIAIIISLIIIIIIFARKKVCSPKLKGEQGEFTVAQVLGDTVKGEQYIINNLLFSNKSEQSCQIDHILINKFGIWVIETKNYSGNIYGKENQLQWTQVLSYGKIKNKFYNPIKQNETHIYNLSKYLNVKNIFQNVVVFLSDADISNIISDNIYSIHNLASIKSRNTGVLLSVERMEFYYNKLLELKNNKSINIEEHIDNIHKMQNNIQKGICPRCGGKLLLRNGRNGQFYGCSNYPNCKFTKNI